MAKISPKDRRLGLLSKAPRFPPLLNLERRMNKMVRKVKKLISLLMLISLIMTVMLPIQTARADVTPVNPPLEGTALPSKHIPVSGRVLKPKVTDDKNSDWIEIARYSIGDISYSLILRENTVTATNYGSYQYYRFYPNNTSSSLARNAVNAWFNNENSAHPLPLDANLRNFAVTNDIMGTTYTNSKFGEYLSLYDGDISKPKGVITKTGDDIAFLLSFPEAVYFCSTQYPNAKGDDYIQSNKYAKANFGKLDSNKITAQPGNHFWLRSSGLTLTGPNYQACTVGMAGFSGQGYDQTGALTQYQTSSNPTIRIRPALWVLSSIFDEEEPDPTYKLTYDGNESGVANVPPQKTGIPANTAEPISSIVPELEGFIFMGWADTSETNVPKYSHDGRNGTQTTITITKDTTIYAVWVPEPLPTYKLTYHTNTLDSVSGMPVPNPQIATPPDYMLNISSNEPTRNGYTFKGWATASGTSATPGYTYDGRNGTLKTITLSQDTELWAVWEQNPQPPRKLTYDPNTTDPVSGMPVPNPQTAIAPGYTLNIDSAEPTRDGYRFKGWATVDGEYATPIYTFDGRNGTFKTITLNGDNTTIYAVWEETYKLTYDPNTTDPVSGMPVPNPQIAIAPGYTLNIDSAEPTRTGYTFKGWGTVPGDYATPIYTFDGRNGTLKTITLNPDKTLYAVWVKDPTVIILSYDKNTTDDVENMPANQTSTSAPAEFTIRDNVPRRAGHTFKGWATSNASNAAPQYQPGGKITISVDTTLYAVWEKNTGQTYTLTYHENAGGVTNMPYPNPVTDLPADAPTRISDTRPIRDGYRFLGWSLDQHATDPQYRPGDSILMDGNKDLYAVWKERTATDGNGEAAITKILKVPYGTNVPNKVFSFKVTAINVDNPTPDTPNYEYPNMPLVGEPGTIDNTAGTGIFTLEFGKSTPVEEIYGSSPDSAGNTTWYCETPDIFIGAVWPHPGEYEYLIEEIKPNGVPAPDKNNGIIYSGAKYKVTVLVMESPPDSGTYVIDKIGAKVMAADDANPETGIKVDPTPGYDSDYDFSQMIFTNKYWHTKPGANGWTLSIGKRVTGRSSEKSRYFNYEMKITASSLIPQPANYSAYVVEADSTSSSGYKTVTTSENYSGTIAPDGSFTFDSSPTSGVTQFSLKDGQYLIFKDTPVGTSYTVTEKATELYKPSVVVKYNNANTTNYIGSENTDLALPNSVIGSIWLYVSEDSSSANFTNTRRDITPTGINLNDLPFIGIIALVLGTLIALVVVKSRKYKHFN